MITVFIEVITEMIYFKFKQNVTKWLQYRKKYGIYKLIPVDR